MKSVSIGSEIEIQWKAQLPGKGPNAVELVKCTEKLLRT